MPSGALQCSRSRPLLQGAGKPTHSSTPPLMAALSAYTLSVRDALWSFYSSQACLLSETPAHLPPPPLLTGLFTPHSPGPRSPPGHTASGWFSFLPTFQMLSLRAPLLAPYLLVLPVFPGPTQLLYSLVFVSEHQTSNPY